MAKKMKKATANSNWVVFLHPSFIFAAAGFFSFPSLQLSPLSGELAEQILEVKKSTHESRQLAVRPDLRE